MDKNTPKYAAPLKLTDRQLLEEIGEKAVHMAKRQLILKSQKQNHPIDPQ